MPQLIGKAGVLSEESSGHVEKEAPERKLTGVFLWVVDMAYVKIVDENYGYVTRYASEDEWDADDIQYQNDIKGIRAVGENDWHDFAVGFEIDDNNCYYLLYGVYDTGDSFHVEEGRTEYVQLYESREDAEADLKRIEDHAHLNYRIDNIRWESKADQKKLKAMSKIHSPWSVELSWGWFHVPWNGYFEQFQDADIACVRTV